MFKSVTSYAVNGGAILASIDLIQVQAALGIILTSINLLLLAVRLFVSAKKKLSDGKITNEEKAEMAMEILQLTETIADLQKQVKEKSENDRN